MRMGAVENPSISPQIMSFDLDLGSHSPPDRLFSKTDAMTRSVNSWTFESYLRGLAGMTGSAADRTWGSLLQVEAAVCSESGTSCESRRSVATVSKSSTAFRSSKCRTRWRRTLNNCVRPGAFRRTAASEPEGLTRLIVTLAWVAGWMTQAFRLNGKAVKRDVDEIVVLHQPDWCFGIAQFYEQFLQMENDDVIDCLKTLREVLMPKTENKPERNRADWISGGRAGGTGRVRTGRPCRRRISKRTHRTGRFHGECRRHGREARPLFCVDFQTVARMIHDHSSRDCTGSRSP